MTSVWAAQDSIFTATNAEQVSLPQRLHRVCVLLWRLPKDEVPFAIGRSVAALFGSSGTLRTHSSWARISVVSDQPWYDSQLWKDTYPRAVNVVIVWVVVTVNFGRLRCEFPPRPRLGVISARNLPALSNSSISLTLSTLLFDISMQP